MIGLKYHGGGGGNIIHYTYQDFYQIEKESTYALSEKVLNILSKLSEDVGIPVHSNHFHDPNANTRNSGYKMDSAGYMEKSMKSRGGGGGGNRNKLMGVLGAGFRTTNDEASWENVRKGHTGTALPSYSSKFEAKDGIEKTIQEIRICLNKLTDKNYAKHRDDIKDKMKSIQNQNENAGGSEDSGDSGAVENSEEEWKKVATILFDIASTNKFFSKIYAQLYLELMEEFAIFQDILYDFMEGFVAKIQTIHYVDPDKDYDSFCQYTKQQDERKATTGFIVHLSVGILSSEKKGGEIAEKLKEIVLTLTKKVVELIDKEQSTNEVEEITEILYLCFSLGDKVILEQWKKTEDWDGFLEQWAVLSKMKVKEHKSLSSRALFKFLDIQNIVSKG
jgi:hypothetical protein